MHVLAVHFEGEEQVFVCGIRVYAELGEVTEEALASGTGSMREGVFCLLEECLQFVAGQFWHVLIVRPNPREFM